MDKAQLCEFVKGAEVIVSLLTDPIDGEVLDAAGPQLKAVAQYTVGYDNIDLEAAKARSVIVTHTAGTLSATAVAELALGGLLAVARHTVQADAYMRSGAYKYWDPSIFLGQQLTGKTVGIIGTGQIGSLFATMCHHVFRAKILYTDMVSNLSLEKSLGAMKVSKEELLARADVVSLHVPLLASTRHLIGEGELQQMKKTAILINTSRGPVVDEGALVRALQNREIFGACLDVYESEPDPAEGLAALDNVVLTPHIASATETTRTAMAECVVRNIKAVLAGETPPDLVR